MAGESATTQSLRARGGWQMNPLFEEAAGVSLGKIQLLRPSTTGERLAAGIHHARAEHDATGRRSRRARVRTQIVPREHGDNMELRSSARIPADPGIELIGGCVHRCELTARRASAGAKRGQTEQSESGFAAHRRSVPRDVHTAARRRASRP